MNLAGKLPQDADTGLVSTLEIPCIVDYIMRHVLKLLYMCFATNMGMLEPGAETLTDLMRGKELLPHIYLKKQVILVIFQH